MSTVPEFVYDADSRTIFVRNGDTTVELLTDASRQEFELVSAIDKFVTSASSLLDRTLTSMASDAFLPHQRIPVARFPEFLQQAAEHYQRGCELQETVRTHDSDILDEHLGMLYKTEKFLKHFLRCLSIAQSLEFSRRLGMRYLSTNDHVYLYSFVRNSCSTFEYLGKLGEHRLGAGELDSANKGITCVDVYQSLGDQDLYDPLNPDHELQIPPTGQHVSIDDMAIELSSMEYLWKKRNEIVHHCPLLADAEIADRLPNAIQNSQIITSNDVKKLTHLSFRIQYYSVCLFFQLFTTYITDLGEQMVEAWYPE